MLKLSGESYEWALKQAQNYGDTNIFPKAFEYEAISQQRNDFFPWLKQENILEWKSRPSRRCLIPKHRYGFRPVTQLDPIDFLVYSALMYEIGRELEAVRIPTGQQIVQSYRFDPDTDGRMYNKSFTYDSFIERSRELADEQYRWVVIADIADFFPRLYHHRVVNALSSSTRKNNHVKSIGILIKNWNESYSYGIPVGPAASSLLAEIALKDIDQLLLSEGAVYVRFTDDFRIFCKTKREAYQRLVSLANILFENHGLTLQQQKTKIMTIDKFVSTYLATEKDVELNTLSAVFRRIVSDLGLASDYEEIDWDDLSTEQQRDISGLNLRGVLEEQARLDEIDIPLCRFILRRLGQIGDTQSLEPVLDNIDNLYPLLPHVIRYIGALHNLTATEKNGIGIRLLDCLESSVVSHLEFHRMWLLSIFASDTEYDQEERFSDILSKCTDQFSQRRMILALGTYAHQGWFRLQKRHVFDFPHWIRRSILIGGSCLPSDERKHWYNSLKPRLDPLERVVVRYARSR